MDKEAKKAYNRAYQELHKEEIEARRKSYYSAHKDEQKAHSKNYYATHREEAKTKRKAYRAAHKDEIDSYNAAHKADDAARKRAYRATPGSRVAQLRAHGKDIVCAQCGKHAKMYIRPGQPGKFCSHECLCKWQVGPNAPGWRGGISFAPYCPKFNAALKEEVRSQFGRRCFLSGKEENGRKLAVHHCDYLKSQGCQGQRWSLLPLDHGWHMKTNANRWYWFALLRDYWAYKYLTFHGMDIYEGPDRTAWLWEMYGELVD